MRQSEPRQQAVRDIASRTAEALGFELVDVTLQKEADGMGLCVYIDKAGGVTLDDCERYHKAVLPLVADVEYDYLEVSSPGADRPIETPRDVQKHRGDKVEVRLFAKLDGAKQLTGELVAMDAAEITIALANGTHKTFPRKAVAIVRPVVDVTADEE